MIRLRTFVFAATTFVSGCSTLPSPHAAFDDVAQTVYQRNKAVVVWDEDETTRESLKQHTSNLLARDLTAPIAVQIALLNNRSLQATYADIGIALADVIEADTLANPSLHGSALWPYSPETLAANLTLGMMLQIVDLFHRPLKQAVTQSQLETAKLRVAREIIAHSARTHQAFVSYIAQREEVALYDDMLTSAKAIAKTAKALRAAGNITALELEQRRSILAETKVRVMESKTRLANTRAQLNALMGLSEEDAHWHTSTRLPKTIPARRSMDEALQTAWDNSFDLALLEQDLITLGHKYKLNNRRSLLPNLAIGAEWEREDSEKKFGPTLDVTLPIFDRGEAARVRHNAEIRKVQNQYVAKSIEVRAAARRLLTELDAKQKIVAEFKHNLLPLHQRLVREMQKQHNAMQQGVFALITAKRNQANVRRQYIQAVAEYWKTHGQFVELLSGRLPLEAAPQSNPETNLALSSPTGGH